MEAVNFRLTPAHTETECKDSDGLLATSAAKAFNEFHIRVRDSGQMGCQIARQAEGGQHDAPVKLPLGKIAAAGTQMASTQ